MANNRMYLVNPRTGARHYIAKYYPSSGWYLAVGVDRDAINAMLDASDFGHLTDEDRIENARKVGFGPPYSAGGMHGDHWALEYEE